MVTILERAVVITGMTKQFSNGRGIQNIDLTIYQGEIVGILGPNGAGKTTLLKCLTGLTSPDRGKVELFGIDIQSNYKEAIGPVGALIGPAVAYEKMSPYINLKMISRLYSGITDTDIDMVLQQTGLTPFKDEKISSFSMGMKQRFGIASALISKPRLIVLDEPTNGLDIDGLLLLRKTIQEISKHSGVTFVISSHHISELEKLCNRFCFLINGEVSLYEAGNEPLEDVYVRKVEVAVR
ncbi:ABC-2 type transport system ATP-binding protein [Bacillus niacini]|uniref:ABC-2 type transport system ATP-binding protein n=1 Tax=Neobacillus niacini TaxID=86668 RepID=A0A852TDH9_9BACI|nr:ABC transporter ATP-binding protein [Neobacillus niacini]NYE05448.1 ABC-2 type transport system ATP-binding protein [Neobacillus niacini]